MFILENVLVCVRVRVGWEICLTLADVKHNYVHLADLFFTLFVLTYWFALHSSNKIKSDWFALHSSNKIKSELICVITITQIM